MKKFFMDLMSAESPTSSKRFAALITLFSCIALAFLGAYKNSWVCPEFMYNGLLLVVAGLFGFNMAESIFKKSTPIPIEDLKEETPKEDVKEEDTDETK